MKRLSWVLISLGLFSTALLSGVSVAAERSAREALVASAAFTTVYTVDDHLTMATVDQAASDASVFDGFKMVCAEQGKMLEKGNKASSAPSYDCPGSFSVTGMEGSGSFLVKHSEAQPVNYRTPAVPSYANLSAPPNGKLKASYSSADLYEYLYVLCRKENGTPSFVVPRRHGKFVRMTKVAPAEAFDFITASGSGKDAWYAACEGEKRFMFEKEYKYSAADKESLIFHANRGLEGISFVKREEAPSYSSKLDAVIADEAVNAPGTRDFIREMAWEVASTKTDFVKTLEGSKYTGSYEPMVNSCGVVTIARSEGENDGAAKTVFSYRVCDGSAGTSLSALLPSVGTLFASWSR